MQNHSAVKFRMKMMVLCCNKIWTVFWSGPSTGIWTLMLTNVRSCELDMSTRLNIN